MWGSHVALLLVCLNNMFIYLMRDSYHRFCMLIEVLRYYWLPLHIINWLEKGTLKSPLRITFNMAQVQPTNRLRYGRIK